MPAEATDTLSSLEPYTAAVEALQRELGDLVSRVQEGSGSRLDKVNLKAAIQSCKEDLAVAKADLVEARQALVTRQKDNLNTEALAKVRAQALAAAEEYNRLIELAAPCLSALYYLHKETLRLSNSEEALIPGLKIQPNGQAIYPQLSRMVTSNGGLSYRIEYQKIPLND